MPKRRFFQIHLSTAVVLMLVAGVLVWANVRESKERPRLYNPEWGKSVLVWANVREGKELPRLYNPEWGKSDCGWPFSYKSKYRYYDNDAYPHFNPNPTDEVQSMRHENIFPTMLIYDVVIAASLLLALCVACEWRIRRRAVRKANA